jgi:hypothetical protein
LLVLLRNGWRLYGPAPDLEGVERELSRRRHDERREELRQSHRAHAYGRARNGRDRRL